MINRLGHYLSRPGNYLFIAFHDIPFRVFFIVLVSKLLLFDHIMGLGTLSFSPDFGVIIILLGFSLLIKKNFLKLAYLLSLNIFCSFIFLLNSLYRGYFGDFASAYCINQIPMLMNVADSVIYLMGKEFLFISDLLLLPLLFPLLKKKNKYEFNIVDRVKAFSILFLLGLFCNSSIFANIKAGINNFFNFNGERSILVGYTGIINYQLIDAFCYLESEAKKKHITQADFDVVKKWLHENNIKRAAVNKSTGIGRGHNVIAIQVESLQNFVIGNYYNGRQITPHLNRLVTEGIYFSNIYDQTAAGNSSDATFLANCSLYPSSRGAVSYLYPQNSFDCLPGILKEHGYASAVLDPHASSFWNSVLFDKRLGFQQQFYENDFVMQEKIGLGLSDRAFLMQSLEKIKGLPKPFYVSLRTLTTHFPYYYVTRKIDNFPLGDQEEKTIGHYIRSMHYVDLVIGEFLHKLSENDLASNTVIVIYGDHRARLSDSELKLIGITDMNENRKIPFIIYLSNRNQPYKNDSIGGLIDVAPTLCNILGIDISDKFFLGGDLLNNHTRFVIFRDGSYLSKEASIDNLYAREQLRISDLIIEKDMISLLRDKKIYQ